VDLPAATYATVVVTIQDKDGGSVSTNNLQIVVDNPPSITSLSLAPLVNGVPTANENDLVTLSGSFTDLDASDTQRVTINWGDGTSSTIASPAPRNFSSTHRYKDNPAGQASGGKYTINVTVTDSPGLTGRSPIDVVINNAAPVITSPDAAAHLPIWINWSDAGTLDYWHMCNVNWGDGTTTTFQAAESGGTGYCTSGHSYATPGTYTISVTVTDKDGTPSATRNFPLTSN
jgi:hypothetical protein